MFLCVALCMADTGVVVIASAQPRSPMSDFSVDAGSNSICKCRKFTMLRTTGKGSG